MKRPSFQFYPGDWLRDTALRSCSVEARGLWVDILCWMHEGSPYGHLKVNSKVILSTHLAGMVGITNERVNILLNELEEAGVFSRDNTGCIFSRRMVQDEGIRQQRSAGGKEGGNPKLIGEYNKPGFVYAMERLSDRAIKIGISAHPEKRIYKIRQQYPNDEITLIAKKYFDNMGEIETQIHNVFSAKKQGEWFQLSTQEKDHLLFILASLHLKENSKENLTPSSPSPSPSPKEKISKKETTVRKRTRKDQVPLPEDFCFSETTKNNLQTKYPTLDVTRFENYFIEKCSANGYLYSNWQAAPSSWLARMDEQELISWKKRSSDNIPDAPDWAKQKVSAGDGN